MRSEIGRKAAPRWLEVHLKRRGTSTRVLGVRHWAADLPEDDALDTCRRILRLFDGSLHLIFVIQGAAG